jgi:hypothetical protein
MFLCSTTLPPLASYYIYYSLKRQTRLLIVNRSRKRSPNLHASDRILAGLLALLVPVPGELIRWQILMQCNIVTLQSLSLRPGSCSC